MEIDKNAFHQLTYGLFLISVKEGDKDNGCIITTVQQIASEPRMLSASCIKGNLTQEMIEATGKFNVSVLDKDTQPEVFERFGMASGHDKEKFTEEEKTVRLENGIICWKDANAVFGCVVKESLDLSSHMFFIAEVIEAKKLSDAPSITYGMYQEAKKNKELAKKA